MKKITATTLFYCMMGANALFTLATLLGAFSGRFSQIIPYVIIAMTVAFIVFAISFFARIQSFGIWAKISGAVYSLSSTVLGIVLSVMSTLVLPEDDSFQGTIKLLGLFIVPLGALLFASFYQTYFWVAKAADSLGLGLIYIALLSIVMISSLFAGNTFGTNLGLTTLVVAIVVFIFNRKNLVAKPKKTKK